MLPGEEAGAVTAGKALTQECIPLISRQITHRKRERETETQDSLYSELSENPDSY